MKLTDGRLVRHELPDFVLATPADKRGECVVEDDGAELWWPLLDDGVGMNWLFGVTEAVIYRLMGIEERGPYPEDLELQRKMEASWSAARHQRG